MKNILRKVIAVLLLFVVGISYLSFTSGAEDIEGYVQPKNYVPTINVTEDDNQTTKKGKIKYEYVYLIEKGVTEVLLYNQLDYPNIPYGNYGTIASHGCGITALAMVASYLTDEIYTPDQLAKKFGNYNTEEGSLWTLFEDSAEKLDLNLQERTYDTKKVIRALKNGQVVIALESENIFTDGGHFIVLDSVNEKGNIVVKDPYGNNYIKNSEMIEGFKNGFTEKQVFTGGGPYWIYAKKK